jgi:hypothetical protein
LATVAAGKQASHDDERSRDTLENGSVHETRVDLPVRERKWRDEMPRFVGGEANRLGCAT